MTDFKAVELFGGAMTVEIPSTFEDVSEIRQVPDNQEVWLDKDGFSSIVFDILERVDKASDIEALKFHLSDIVDEDAGSTRIFAAGEAHFAHMPNGIPASTLLAISPPGDKQRGRPNEPDFVGVLLTLLRLEAQKTDVIIAINVPHLPGQYDKDTVDPSTSKYGRLLEVGMQVRDKLFETFEVKDYGLFVQE